MPLISIMLKEYLQSLWSFFRAYPVYAIVFLWRIPNRNILFLIYLVDFFIKSSGSGKEEKLSSVMSLNIFAGETDSNSAFSSLGSE